MKNFVQNGHMIAVPAPTGGIESGAGIIIGNLFGIAAMDAAEGKDVEIATTGVFDLPKAPAAVFTLGQLASWDATNNQVVAPATGMYPIGIVTQAAANGSTMARVRLDGGSVIAV